MGISLSGGDYQYNRFDAFEKSLEEGKGASNPFAMKAKVDSAAVKTAEEGRKAKVASAKQTAKQEKGSKTGLAVEELLNNEETNETVMEDNQRMAMYSRALGVMGAHYSGSPIAEKKKDDEPEDERKSAADRAAEEKRQKKEGKKGEAEETEEIEKNEDEDMKKDLPWLKGKKSKNESVEYSLQERKQGESAEDARDRHAARKGEKRLPKADGDEYARGMKVHMNRRNVAKDIGSQPDPHGGSTREEVELTKDMVVEYLVHEGYANNEVSAEILHKHISDDFLSEIEKNMLDCIN